ncbi:MAG: peptidyl-prolyl cis-trans isomerase [Ruegeria sp.]
MKFYKEPMFHFFLFGIMVFAWFFYLNPDEATGSDDAMISISERELDRLITEFSAARQRPPTLAELSGIVDAAIREEVLVREARTLGLEQGDQVIKNRLVQKMEFLTTSAAQAVEPERSVLEEHMKKYPERFATTEKIAFEQVAFGMSPDQNAVEDARVALQSGASPDSVGVSSLLPASIPLSSSKQIDGMFGFGFAAEVAAMPAGEWSGPVSSGYGAHLVKLDQMQSSEVLPLDDVYQAVLFDWRGQLQHDLLLAGVESLKSRYQVDAPSRSEIEQRLAQ